MSIYFYENGNIKCSEFIEGYPLSFTQDCQINATNFVEGSDTILIGDTIHAKELIEEVN